MRKRCLAVGLLLCAGRLMADVGSGSPDLAIQQSFLNAYWRSGFYTLVGAPFGNVTKYGSTGLIQQFPSATSTSVTLALIKPDSTDTDNVVQMQAAMFAYYGTISAATAGYPTG